MRRTEIYEDADFDISSTEEKIIKSLRYMRLSHEYKLVDNIRSAKQYTFQSQNSLELPHIQLPVKNHDGNFKPDGDAVNIMSSLRTMINKPDAVEKIILSIRCKSSKKEKFIELIKTDTEGLNKVIAELMLLNLINSQSKMKDAIEKLILLKYLKERFHRSNNETDIEPENIMPELQQLLSGNYNDYYTDYLDENFLEAFISKLRFIFKDDKIHLLVDKLNCTDWKHNQKILKHCISYGTEYVKIMQNKRREAKNKIPAFGVHPRGEDLIARFKVIEAFTKEFIPNNAVTLKTLTRLIENYFTPSKWRSRTACDLKSMCFYKGLFNLDLEPCKDSSMALRFLAGSDCTEYMNSQLADPASAFYKIMLLNDWIGYITLLNVKTANGIKAILIDVINICELMVNTGFTIEAIFENFVDSLTENLYEEGFRYLLIPAEAEYLSNSNSFSIYDRYMKNSMIDGPLYLFCGRDEEYRNDRLSDFQTLKCESFIIIRDFEFHTQGILPGFE